MDTRPEPGRGVDFRECTVAPSSPVPSRSWPRGAFALGASDAGTPGRRTRWAVRTSEGLDAVSFLGPLSGRPLYTEPYEKELATFGPRLPADVRADVPKLWEEAEKGGVGLLAPALDVIFSSDHNGDTLDAVLAGLGAPEQKLLPAYRASPYWEQETWDWVLKSRPRLISVFRGMRTAGFVKFRQERAGKALAERVKSVQRDLEGFDVIKLQEKLTGGPSIRRSTSSCCSSASRTGSRCRGRPSSRRTTTTSRPRSGSQPTRCSIRPFRWTVRPRARRWACSRRTR